MSVTYRDEVSAASESVVSGLTITRGFVFPAIAVTTTKEEQKSPKPGEAGTGLTP